MSAKHSANYVVVGGVGATGVSDGYDVVAVGYFGDADDFVGFVADGAVAGAGAVAVGGDDDVSDAAGVDVASDRVEGMSH